MCPFVDDGDQLDEGAGLFVKLGQQVESRVDLLVETIDEVLGARLVQRVIPEVVAGGLSESRKFSHTKRYVLGSEYLTVRSAQK